MAITGAQICKNALKYKGYVYWYGGKGEKCTAALLTQLAIRYPKVYTTAYRIKCNADIAAGKSCIDCSGLVCKALGIDDISTYQMANDRRFVQYTGAPMNGMIVWKSSHVGIYYNGKVIEARGIDYDVTRNRAYKESDWQRVYAFTGATYKSTVGHTAEEYLIIAASVLQGKLGDGDARKKALESAGYDYDKVQNLVNLAME